MMEPSGSTDVRRLPANESPRPSQNHHGTPFNGLRPEKRLDVRRDVLHRRRFYGDDHEILLPERFRRRTRRNLHRMRRILFDELKAVRMKSASSFTPIHSPIAPGPYMHTFIVRSFRVARALMLIVVRSAKQL